MDIRLTRYIILLALLPLLLLAMAGCGGNGAARRSLDRADSLMNSKPEVAMAILDSVNAESLHGKKEKARYALLKSIALDKNYVDTTDFSVLQPAIDYYLKHGTADEKIKTYYYRGIVYLNRKDNDSAMLCFMNGRNCAGMQLIHWPLQTSWWHRPFYKFRCTISRILRVTTLWLPACTMP